MRPSSDASGDRGLPRGFADAWTRPSRRRISFPSGEGSRAGEPEPYTGEGGDIYREGGDIYREGENGEFSRSDCPPIREKFSRIAGEKYFF